MSYYAGSYGNAPMGGGVPGYGSPAGGMPTYGAPTYGAPTYGAPESHAPYGNYTEYAPTTNSVDPYQPLAEYPAPTDYGGQPHDVPSSDANESALEAYNIPTDFGAEHNGQGQNGEEHVGDFSTDGYNATRPPPPFPAESPAGGGGGAPIYEIPKQESYSSESVSKLANQFSASSLTSPTLSTGSQGKKWVVDTKKGSSGGYMPQVVSTGITKRASSSVSIDPTQIDTSSANVSEVRKLWKEAAKNAPPPLPKVKAGGVSVATESVSTVSTVGLFDRSMFARISSPARGNWANRPPSVSSGISSAADHDDKPASDSFERAQEAVHFEDKKPMSAGSGDKVAAAPPQPIQKPSMPPQAVEFHMDQFKELMEQVKTGDADQKAYAAMELQTMALDSKSQVLMAQNGAIGPLVQLLQPGDPMVQASAAGALWNLAANEHNKLAIAEAGAIQPLVAMLYSDVREAQLSAAGALQNLCVNPRNKKTVANAGGIEALMMLLSDKDRHVKAKAAGALQSLAVDEENQKKIKSLGAIPLITKLLSSRTPEVQSNAAGALHNLAVNDEEAQEAVANAGAITPLISLMQGGSADLQAKAAATIWSIAGREDNRRRIMEEGGIAPLVKMVQSSHTDCQAKASGAIRCLTMSAFTRPEFEKAGVIPHLVVLLSSGNQEITINAAGALENLGCR